MKNQTLPLLFLFLSAAVQAQSYCDFQKLIDDGKAMAKKENYEMAMYKFNSARRCDPTKGEVVDKEVENLFKAINRKKQQAETAQRRAEAEKRRADEERDKAIAAQKEADAQRRRAEAVLDKIYFYDGKFGLAYQNGSYGFIDKQLNTKINFRYEEALPFDYTGYAKVKKGDSRYYLVDTTGAEFLLATDVSQLSPVVTALDLRNKTLDAVPDTVFSQTQLKVLLMASNQLSALPVEIAGLKNLQSLGLYYNKLSALPAEIAELKNLQSLDLSSNQLSALPAEIAELKNLQSLELSGNQLSALPAEIAELKNLQSLYLGDNQLRALPAEITELKNLQSLGLRGNQLSVLPAEIAELKNLQSLHLSDNQLSVLPAEIRSTKFLKELNLNGNPFSAEYIEILQKDMPGCKIDWESPESIKKKEAVEITGTAASEALQAGDYVLFDSFSQIQITALRELYVQDSAQYSEVLGGALGNYSFDVCFSDHPGKAIAAGQEAAKLLNETWPRTNEGHGYLLTGQWEQAKAVYIAIKETDGKALWQDFQALARAGIRHPDMVKAAELVLGRPLTAEERELLEGKKE